MDPGRNAGAQPGERVLPVAVCFVLCHMQAAGGGEGGDLPTRRFCSPRSPSAGLFREKKQLVLLPSRADRRTQTGHCTLKIAPCQRGVPTTLLPGAALLLGRTGQLIIVRLALP